MSSHSSLARWDTLSSPLAVDIPTTLPPPGFCRTLTAVILELYLPGLDFTGRGSKCPCVRAVLYAVLGKAPHRHMWRHCFNPSGINGCVWKLVHLQMGTKWVLPFLQMLGAIPSFLTPDSAFENQYTLLFQRWFTLLSLPQQLSTSIPQNSAVNTFSQFLLLYLLPWLLIVLLVRFFFSNHWYSN